MRHFLKTSFLIIITTTLMGCGDEDILPVGETQNEALESLDTSKNKSTDDGSLFTTIYCKLSTTDGSFSTYTTYFKYDETTVNYPSDIDIKHALYLENPFNREHWARAHGKYRLIDVSIELPTAATQSAYKADAKNMYYMHGQSWHFFKPQLKSEGGWFELSNLAPGLFFFGERTGPEEFAGHLEFTTGNQYGALSGGKNGSVGAWYYNGKSGPINLCASKRAVDAAR